MSRWLAAHRQMHDVRPWHRAATPFVQAVLVLRWFKDGTDIKILARDARVSIATGYRSLHEAIDVIAQCAPDLPDVLARGLREGWDSSASTAHSSRRCARPANPKPDMICGIPASTTATAATCRSSPDPTVTPNWVSHAEPGSTHDIAAARTPCRRCIPPPWPA